MGCCCSTPLEKDEPIIKIEDLTINDLSQNFHELGTCFICKKTGIDVLWYPDQNNTLCDKCHNKNY